MVGEADEIRVDRLEWDSEIIDHIARHAVSREDVESVLNGEPRFYRNVPGRSATHVMVGLDSRGRVLFVPILCTEEPDEWRVISAWESRFARRLLSET